MSEFEKKIRDIVRTIPKGQYLSYKEVAERVGNPNASRAVANVMAKNYDPDIPCHRVIRSDGKLGGYNRGGTKRKRAILRAEGANVQ